MKTNDKNRDFFTNLPQEITINILSTLPIRTIMNCKCVCKSWRDLVESPEFAPLHFAQSASASGVLPAIEDLKFSKPHSNLGFLDYEVIENSSNSFLLSHNWPNPNARVIRSSANGLLVVCGSYFPSQIFICNPITREYIRFKIQPERVPIFKMHCAIFGFGVSKTGQYKLAKISFLIHSCEVYTLGTGQWRSIAMGSQIFPYRLERMAAFVNGNLYWLLFDLDLRKLRVSCLDLETELFTSFPCPPLSHVNGRCSYSLSALGVRLCLCDDSDVDEIVMWFMKEYGDEKSWTKEFVIKKKAEDLEIGGILFPIKAFKDGGILFALGRSSRLFYYSNTNKAIQEIEKGKKGRILEGYSDYCTNVVIFSPNFVSLKTLVMDTMSVESF